MKFLYIFFVKPQILFFEIREVETELFDVFGRIEWEPSRN